MNPTSTPNVVLNGIWNALASATGAVTGIVASLMIVRSLSVEDYGIFSYYLWLGGTLVIAGSLALPHALTKLTSELRGRGAHGEAYDLTRWVLLSVLGINLIMTAGVLLWAFHTPAPQRTFLFIVAMMLIPQNLASVLRSSLWGLQLYLPVSFTIVLALIVQITVIGWAYLSGSGVIGYLTATLVANAAAFAMLLIVSYTTSPDVFLGMRRPRRESVQSYLYLVIPVTLIVVIEAVVWQRSEVYFLYRLSTLDQVGYYNLAFTIFGMFLMLGLALVNSFFPAISRDFGAHALFAVREKVSKAILLGMVYAVPLCFGGWATFPHMITLMYGSQMQPAVLVLNVLLLGLLPGVLVGVYSLTMTAMARPWLNVRIGLVMALVNLGLNALLISRFGAVGGATASVTAQVVYFGLMILALWKVTGQTFPWRDGVTLVSIGAVSAYLLPMLVLTLLPGVVGLSLAVPAAAACYAWLVHRAGYIRRLGSLRSGSSGDDCSGATQVEPLS